MANIKSEPVTTLENYKSTLLNPTFHISHKTAAVGVRVQTRIDAYLTNALRAGASAIDAELQSRQNANRFLRQWKDAPLTVLLRIGQNTFEQICQCSTDVNQFRSIYSELFKQVSNLYQKTWPGAALDEILSMTCFFEQNSTGKYGMLCGQHHPDTITQIASKWNHTYATLYTDCLNAAYRMPNNDILANMLSAILAAKNNCATPLAPYLIAAENGFSTIMTQTTLDDIRKNSKQYVILYVLPCRN